MKPFCLCALLFLSSIVVLIHPCRAATQNPCDVITKAEAETLLGTKLVGPELSPRKTLCKYYEPGYGESSAKNKLITIGLFYSDKPGRDDVNNRRQALLQDSSISPFAWHELPNFADAALWEWAGGYFGALYAFRGGTVEVAVKISGLSEQVAREAAKKFAARALGSTARTGFEYAAPSDKTLITAKVYNAPGILGPLYLGSFSAIPDDEMTRNYVLSLVQQFNGSCEQVPEAFAIMGYGAYYEWKANTDILKSGMKSNLDKQFQDWVEVMHRVHPHILAEGNEDARKFLELHNELGHCYTSQVAHLYTKIADLALERQNIPPDVDNDEKFFSLLSPKLAAEYRARGVPLPNHPSLAMQHSLQNTKQACLNFTKGGQSGEMEVFCRCQVDALKEGHVPAGDLDKLSAHFTQEAMTELGTRYPEYAQRKRACYH